MDATTHVPFDRSLFQLGNHNYSDRNHYYYFKNGFSPEECSKILKSFAKFCTNDSYTFNSNEKTKLRTSKIFWIPRNNDTMWIYDKLLKYAGIANSKMFEYDVCTLRDQIQLTLYDSKDEGQYGTHIDLGSNNEYACRKLSMSVQLSDPDDYTGGEVEFDEKLNFPTGLGDVMVFSAFTRHKVNPVKTGKRYSMVLWLYGPPFR